MQDSALTKFILHIGDAKTGTTSIQKAIQLGAITSASGGVEAYTTLRGGANSIAVARAFRDDGTDQGVQNAQAVNAWLHATKARYAILSSEYFSRADARRLHDTFVAEIPDFAADMRVIAYVRPHASRLLSAFVQRLKTRGGVTSLDKQAENIQRSNILAYAPRFAKWADLYGDRFTLRPFVRAELAGGDAVEDFFKQVFQEAPFTLTSVIRENTTLTERTLAGLAVVHQVLKKAEVGDRQRGKIARSIYDNLPESVNKDQKAPALSRAAVELLFKHYAEDAREVDARFFGRNILAQELDKALASAQPQEPDLSPKAHFEQAEIKAVKQLSLALSKKKRKSDIEELAAVAGDDHEGDDDGDLSPAKPDRKPPSKEAAEIARILAG